MNWRFLPHELDEFDGLRALIEDFELLDLYRALQKPTKELTATQNEQVGKALQLESEYTRDRAWQAQIKN